MEKGAHVRAIVRDNPDDHDKLQTLREKGVEVIKTDITKKAGLITALKDVSVVVSALQGLGDVILDTPSTLLEAALETLMAINRNIFKCIKIVHIHQKTDSPSNGSIINCLLIKCLLLGYLFDSYLLKAIQNV